MPKYQIHSGELDVVVEAPDMDEAITKAIQEANNSDDPPLLGLILRSVEIVGEVYYMGTESACKKAGCWAGQETKS